MIRAVADTNIYISALNFGGNPERFLKGAQAGGFQLIISDAILEEVGKVLRCEKFRWPEEQIAKAQREISLLAGRVEPTETLHVITADPPDDRILECAIAGKADYIVTGDNHLLASIGRMRKATPRLLYGAERRMQRVTPWSITSKTRRGSQNS